MSVTSEVAFERLKDAMNAYWVLPPVIWARMQGICRVEKVQKGQHLLHIGDMTKSFYFICEGIVRSYALAGENLDKEVTKNFFVQGTFPASLCALLKGEESTFGLQALEDSQIIYIDHQKYRSLLAESEDLKWYHIHYLEKHWVMENEPQSMAMLGSDSQQRYLNFIAKNPDLIKRVKLHHIASHLGITPTQLSRIRKEVE